MMLGLGSWADPSFLSLPFCPFFCFPPIFPPPPPTAPVEARAWKHKEDSNTTSAQSSRSVGVGRWICSHICSRLTSMPLLFNHPLEPWPSSLLHTSEFLRVCSLLWYLVFHNSKLSFVVCDLRVSILSP